MRIAYSPSPFICTTVIPSYYALKCLYSDQFSRFVQTRLFATDSARVMARVVSLLPSSSRLISATVPATVNVSLANWPKDRNEQIPSGLLHASATSDMEVGAQYNVY